MESHRRARFACQISVKFAVCEPYRRAVAAATGPVKSRWVLAAVSIALFCVQIDYFAAKFALPRMASELHSTASDLQWVISVYMLTFGRFMVPAGRMRRYLLVLRRAREGPARPVGGACGVFVGPGDSRTVGR